MPLLEPAPAEHQGAGKADAASRLHAGALHRPDPAGSGNPRHPSGLQAESERGEPLGGSRPTDAVDPAEPLPGKARQCLREECAVDRVGVFQADQSVH